MKLYVWWTNDGDYFCGACAESVEQARAVLRTHPGNHFLQEKFDADPDVHDQLPWGWIEYMRGAE